ncbi:MAG: anhydro-N-acetylmuramic acid kinase [Bacteroidetes bacterium]|nr:anhydro-N-acetylmuramic acid kinase [Bacteroidota bacterium]
MHEKKLNRNSLLVLGAMSGTSADGIDFALTELSGEGDKITHRVLAAETVGYSKEWLAQLREAEQCSAVRLAELHALYGKHTGEQALRFLQRHSLQADALSMHGHTLFHQPGRGFTFQLGSGAAAAAAAGLVTICDFRSTDVALGGQGAPLVPVGDRLLFSEADACLNLGGFANVSFETETGRIAFDICAVNYVLNRLAQRSGKAYDESGRLAQSGKLIAPLFEQLECLPWYTLPPPKSLGREWVEAEIFPLLTEKFAPEDLLHTFTEHTASQISAVCKNKGNVLITGGGTHNTYLLERCRHFGFSNQLIPQKQTIDFKEAVVFALLGWLRLQHLPNALGSVTGARKNSCSGAVYLP